MACNWNKQATCKPIEIVELIHVLWVALWYKSVVYRSLFWVLHVAQSVERTTRNIFKIFQPKCHKKFMILAQTFLVLFFGMFSLNGHQYENPEVEMIFLVFRSEIEPQ